MKTLKNIKVFLASPGDLSEERKMFPEIIDQVNNIKGNILGFNFKAVGWEDALPNFGRPQAIINKDVEECDIFAMLLWTRWGTPSGKFSSGAEEEYIIAFERYQKNNSPHFLLYFRSVPQQMMADPGEQLSKVIAFRTKIETEKLCLFTNYETPERWKELLVQHLCFWLDKQLYGKEFATQPEEKAVSIPLEATQKIADLEKQLQEQSVKLETAQSKLQKEAIALAVKALEFINEGKFTLAEEMFAKSLELFEDLEVLNTFGTFLAKTGSFTRAEEKFKQILNSPIINGTLKAHVYGNLGNIYTKKGDFKIAEEMQGKGMKIYQDFGMLDQVASSLHNLGNIYKLQGELKKAETVFEKSAKINEELGRKDHLASNYTSLGDCYRTKSDWTNAKGMYTKALEIASKSNLLGVMAQSYNGLGNVYLGKGDDNDLDAAEKMFNNALELISKTGLEIEKSAPYNNLGIVYKRRGDLDKAEEFIRKQLGIDTAIGSKQGMAIAYGNLGTIYMSRGEYEKAKEMHGKSLEINNEIGRKEGLALSYMNLGAVFQYLEKFEDARINFVTSNKLFSEIGNEEMTKTVQILIDDLPKKP